MYVKTTKRRRTNEASFANVFPTGSDGLLLYLLCFRVAQQSAFEEIETLQMAAIDHGCLGCCDGG